MTGADEQRPTLVSELAAAAARAEDEGKPELAARLRELVERLDGAGAGHGTASTPEQR